MSNHTASHSYKLQREEMKENVNIKISMHYTYWVWLIVQHEPLFTTPNSFIDI